MARTFVLLVTSFLCVASAGCQSSHELVGVDLDGDGEVDPVPEGRGGPWFACDDALAAGSQGDVCDFDGYCGAISNAPAERRPLVGCIEHQLTFVVQLGRADCSATGPLTARGACVDYPHPRCMPGVPSFVGTTCVGYEELPPDDGVPAAPWPFHGTSDCEILRPGHAENGDPCEGDFICDMEWSSSAEPGEGRLTNRVIAWCDASAVRLVFTAL